MGLGTTKYIVMCNKTYCCLATKHRWAIIALCIV